MLLDISERLHTSAARRVTEAPDAEERWTPCSPGRSRSRSSQPALITVHDRELGNVPEPARRQIRRLQRLYVEEWVTVLSELYPACPPPRLRAATHAIFGLLNSTPHSAGELASRGDGRAVARHGPGGAGRCPELGLVNSHSS